jgi:hypothetical protein
MSVFSESRATIRSRRIEKSGLTVADVRYKSETIEKTNAKIV